MRAEIFTTQHQHFNSLSNKVYQPVLPHFVSGVQCPLISLVVSSSRWRKNLDHQVRRSLHISLGDYRSPFVRDKHQVGLSNVVFGQNHIQRREPNTAQVVLLDESSNCDG